MLQYESTPYIFNLLFDIIFKAPIYVIFLEGFLLLMVIWVLIHKQTNGSRKLTEEQKKEIIKNWKPEPLVPEVDENDPTLKTRTVEGPIGKYIFVDGHKCLNMSTFNYLGLEEYPQIKKSAIETIRKYGVGSCGPRGFYGTLDVHLELEERLAKFMDQEEAVVYSYAFSTIASAIPAYSKRNDIIFADECVNFAIQKGIDASRSKVVYFKHNNMRDLEEKLIEQHKMDVKKPQKAAKMRRFLVAEGIYLNTGEMCPLRELVQLRSKYKLRMILDESVSFGTIGKHGRGLTEFLGVDKTEVDLISASLEASVESVGGFCVGTHFIVEHQRLSGLGYCFSASQPPLLTQVVITALDIFEKEPKIFKDLNEVCEKVDKKFKELSRFLLRGHPISPIKHLYLKDDKTSSETDEILRKISDQCIKMGLAIVPCAYLPIEKFPQKPSLRVAVNRLLSNEEITKAFNILQRASYEIK
ncbi:CLUMA_CG017799, isoform A [Clunio marinus]|uniref:Serine palmitoyltransferase 1 n=1 Tax=Clunio marinus TaxID=568069 RepID=A0A1J1IWT0_9DIPT|nr:CLUMA_CG017799, isoform A [Clunio marinus]